MLEYGDAFLEQNREALKRLEETMSPGAFAVALEMASDQDEPEDELEEELAA